MTARIDFEALFTASPNAYMVLDRELRFVFASPEYLRVTASRWEDLAGRHIIDAFPNDPADPNNANAVALRTSLARVIETGKTDTLAFIPYHVPMFEGGKVVTRERYWSCTHTPVFDASGNTVMVMQHTVDVTELYALRQASEGAKHSQWGADVLGRARSAEAEKQDLDEERQLLLRLFHQAPGFMCFTRGPDHVFEIANDSYLRLIGREPGDQSIVGRSIAEVLPDVANQGYTKLLDTVYRTAESYFGRAERLFLRRDDALEEVFLDFTYQAVRDAHGDVLGILTHGYDITSHVRLEREREGILAREQAARAEAERANQAKDDFLAMVSHELRTPLNAIMGWLYVLRDGRLSPEKRDATLNALDRNTRAQAQVINDLLDVSRIVARKLELVPSDTNVADVIAQAVDSARPGFDAKKVALIATLDNAVRAHLDDSRLHQIVTNLLSNAVKFTPSGGTVRVTLEGKPGGFDLRVVDNGVGIDAALLPRVFERFQQGDRITTRTHGGLGLGLAIVRHLVERHGGTVKAESEGVGRGSAFSVFMPTGNLSASAAPAAPASVAPDALAGLVVLVLDDELDAREVVRHVLEEAGAKVIIAASAEAARQSMAANAVDVVVSDLGMPGEDGHSFIQRLRATELPGQRLPAIALSAYARQTDAAAAERSGFDVHMSKPFEPLELLRTVARLGHDTAGPGGVK